MSGMGWSLAKRYTQRRDNELWELLQSKVPWALSARGSWLHAVEEVPFAGGLSGEDRGYLYVDDDALYFTGERDEAFTYLPLVRVKGIQWDDSHRGIAVTFADPTDRGTLRRHWYRLMLPGQSGGSAEVLIKDFLKKTAAAYEKIPRPTEDDLWPPDGSDGIGIGGPIRRTG